MHLTIDNMALFCLAISWWEKRSIDPDRNGFISCTIAISLLLLSLLLLFYGYHEKKHNGKQVSSRSNTIIEDGGNHHVLVLFKVMLFTITVTGPSAAPSAIIFIFQSWALQKLSDIMEETQVSMLK